LPVLKKNIFGLGNAKKVLLLPTIAKGLEHHVLK